MRGPKELITSEKRWDTQIGKSFPGERVVYRGKDLFHDLRNLSWMQLYLLGITGRSFTKEQARLFEGMWTLCTSYPEFFLWNNRVGALAGTARSTGVMALGSAISLSEACIYGGRPIIRSIDFLYRTKIKLDQGTDLQVIIEDELKKYRVIYGYGRPIVNRDERINPLLNLAKELNMAEGTYTRLAIAVEEALLRGRWRIRMNILAILAGLSADQGLTSHEFYFFLAPCFTAGIMPCFIESSQRPEGCFLPISQNRIHYTGHPPRNWTPLEK